VKTNNAHIFSDEERYNLHVVLLEMLLELDRICRRNNIEYYLFMGTMLGAVRHSGFIPWDDDLDVAMMRSEYEKFKEACKKDLDQSKFFYQDHTTDSHYRWGYARIQRKDTEFVRLGQEHLKMRTGIFLDIFPLDNVPDFAPLRMLHHLYCFILRKILYAEVGRKSSKIFILRVWYAFLTIIPHTWVHRRIEKLSMKRKKTKFVRILTFPTPKGKICGYLRKWFENFENIKFENHIFPSIKDYDEFLKYNYGNYMQLPPPEKRKFCHPVSKFKLPPNLSKCRGKIKQS